MDTKVIVSFGYCEFKKNSIDDFSIQLVRFGSGGCYFTNHRDSVMSISFSKLNDKRFIEFLNEYPWEDKESVSAIIQYEEGRPYFWRLATGMPNVAPDVANVIG